MGKLLLIHSPACPTLLQRAWAALPTVQAPDVRLREVRKAEWRHGSFTGWYGAGGIELLALKDNPKGRRGYLSVATHEMGHALYETLTDEAARQWWIFWKGHQPDMPSDYARTSAYEAWGECMEWLYRRPAGEEPLRAVVAAEVRRLLGVSA